jgi:hypothetical protein
VRTAFAIRLLGAVALALATSTAASAATVPEPGTYRGKGAIESRVTDKVVARERFEVVGVLTAEGELQLFFPTLVSLPNWERRQAIGTLDTSEPEAVWRGTPNDDASEITLRGKTTKSSIQLGYDAGTLFESGVASTIHTFMTLKMRRVGP